MAAQMSAKRPYQIVVWGASGFTGRLVCEHIARDYPEGIRWAMAGRDAKKIESVRSDLAKINPKISDVPILVADAQDKAAVGNVLKQTETVLALVGPFAQYGTTVLSEAVEQGTNYCDITGEVPWVKRSIEANDAKAKAKGVKIVHCCGYDSIPSDLGALLMVDHCKNKLNRSVKKVIGLVMPGKGGVSGGTVASGMNTVINEPMSELSKVSSDAYYLSHARQGTDKPAPFRPTFIPEANTWAAPWIMEGPYGSDFHYLEMVQTGLGWSGWGAANATALGMGLFGLGFATAPGRALLKRILPAPGQGPSEETRKSGFWRTRLVAVTEPGPQGEPSVTVHGECGDNRDAGYWSTSRMILETGLALTLDKDQIQKTGECLPSGVLTPATAGGTVLIDRLRKAGFTFKVDA